MNSSLDPRIQAFLKSRGKLAPVGVRCSLIPLSEGKFFVQPDDERDTGESVVQDKEYVGYINFEVNRNPQGRDIVTNKTEVQGLTNLPDTRPIWIPILACGVSDHFVGEDDVTCTREFSVRSFGLGFPDDFRYIWDETTVFTVESQVNGGSTWSDNSLPDDSVITNPTDDVVALLTVTSVRFYLYVGATLIYQILFTYEFDVSGGTPTNGGGVGVEEYLYPGAIRW